MHVLKGLLLCLWLTSLAATADWYPVQVQADGQLLQYQPLARAAQPWRICALLPHGKDRYWWGVAWGLDGEAARQGVRLGIYEAGGYENPQVQIAQLQACRAEDADAYVIASINTDDLCPQIAELHGQGKPVIDLVNRLDCPGVSARSQIDFADMVREILAYIEGSREAGPFSIGWLPGPQGAGWVMDGENGLRQALQGQPVTLYHGGYAPVDRASQAQLVRRLLNEHGEVDYLLGNAEAAGFAAQLVRTSGNQYRTQVLATYTTERILEQIRDGFILAAPTDSPVLQARIAIDLAVRVLEGKPHPALVRPLIVMLDQRGLEAFDISRLMPPEGHWMIRRDMPQ
ncbi:TMAO reductase system periplasmic protein TorT [Aquipseudomonas ullengensis]|uniref:TMAO reductase system periplasmic protein TorT n=1 Tax=Aquipseudomonas ullengensis TaxID=2759166 RepID=A0A7W4LIR5_9GAMM|nr:TMAO reductase system periplasmic protein TorT [Pseudomonas ullengensis]MBB2493881.1 TMAO reductase system periplasmic protein TorT [Pseudomonas ullengensis]